MRVVIALGGNALLRRGQKMSFENQRDNARAAAVCLGEVAKDHQLIVAHGNGPQVGLLALQSAAYGEVDSYPLDVLGAESVGQIGYLIEQEMGNVLPFEQSLATLLTQIEVDLKDPAFAKPSKPIGPVYDKATAEALAAEKGWAIAADGAYYRRVVASPRPKRIFELAVIKLLVNNGVIPICAGGGGIPTAYAAHGKLHGVEAVIDKDLSSGLRALGLDANAFIMLTDVPEVVDGFGSAAARPIRRAHPKALRGLTFAAGSMGPKVLAACEFAEKTGGTAAIGRLEDAVAILQGKAGTAVSTQVEGIEYAESSKREQIL